MQKNKKLTPADIAVKVNVKASSRRAASLRTTRIPCTKKKGK